jgi:hypothetical protein
MRALIEDGFELIEGGLVKQARQSCGVYALVKGGEVIYINYTTRIEGRLRQHKVSYGFEEVWIKPYGKDDGDEMWLAAERLMRKYRPRHNINTEGEA